MNSNTILQSDILDIIFDNRNKAYGAYVLRKFYNTRLQWSIAVTVLLVVIFSGATFLPGNASAKIEVVDIVLGAVKLDEPVERLIPVEQKKVNQRQSPIKSSGTPVVVTEKVIDSIPEPDPQQGSVLAAALPGIDVGGPGDFMNEQAGNSVQEAPPQPEMDVNVPLNGAEVMPEFPGGMSALRKFLERNLMNPRELENDERITVKVQFVVGFDGKLKTFQVIENGGDEFNNEVIRVLKKMPAWIPGRANGRNVSVYYRIPVKFISED